MKTKILILLLCYGFCSCNKNKQPTSPPSNPVVASQSNFYSFKIGATSYSTGNVYGQPIQIPAGDSLLMINAYSATDTISGGFTLKIGHIGIFNHDSITVSENNRFVVNFGNLNNPKSTFISKSGTINISSFDLVNHIYAGTFSAVMTLSTNPTYTLPLTNGSFYLKY